MPHTLLLADDSVTIQRVIELTFAEEDINVVAVSDGDQAIARLDTMPPDIVLVDVGMPGRSGYDVAGHVKQTPHLSHIPVVLLTGAFEPVDEVKANAVGCDGILAKPFEPHIVISRVKELLARPVEAPAPSVPSELAIFAPEMKSAALAPVPVPNPEAVAKLDEYFDQLDSAFARLTTAQPKPPAELVPEVSAAATAAELDWFGPPRGAEAAAFDTSLSLQPTPEPTGLQLRESTALVAAAPALEAPAVFDQINPIAVPDPVPVPVPVAVPEPVEALTAFQAAAPVAYTQIVAATEPVAQRAIAAAEPLAAVPSVPQELPPLGDAFAAILAAEQADPATPYPWPSPSPSPSPAPAAPVITDDMIDRVSRRVIEQLTDRVVREAVSEAVSGIAERLVREEIERIKKTIE